ncbi:MAG: cobyrinic acid a,c-diamide synthase [Gammaproteobacteria bacterium]|jgi:cobyrinic acid a,c-diamide synthase
MTAFYISAAHKSSGKTMVSIGLSRTFRKKGLNVQTFKKGPDYIDPLWLARASRQNCHNLDFYTSSHRYIQSDFASRAATADAIIVEGNKGLFDGVALDGSDSNAAMSKLLDLPVVLVIDASGITRGIAPLLHGYENFDKSINIAGVILNKVAGSRHLSKLTNAVETYTDFKILGAIEKHEDFHLPERHLGLIPQNELGADAEKFIETLAESINQQVNIGQLLNLQKPQNKITRLDPYPEQKSYNLRIAVAMDASFGFYYASDLEEFEKLGVEIVPFNSLQEPVLPENIDGLFIGGGFPETNLEAFSKNQSLLKDIKIQIENGLPTYAECGGLMVLCRSIEFKNKRWPMVDLIPADVKMHTKPQGRGYIEVAATKKHPWLNTATKIKAHEFHYSSLENIDPHFTYAYKVNRGHGVDGINDGIVLYNCLASYSHLRQTDLCHWVNLFVDFVARVKISHNNDNYHSKRCQTN